MADWRLLARNLALVDGRIDPWNAQLIEAELWTDGKINAEELQFLIDLRKGAPTMVVEFEDVIYNAVLYVLRGIDISAEKTRWLKKFLKSDNPLSHREKRFLKEVLESSKTQCKEFIAWCDELGIQEVTASYRRPVTTLPPAAANSNGKPLVQQSAPAESTSFFRHFAKTGVLSLSFAAIIVLWVFAIFATSVFMPPKTAAYAITMSLLAIGIVFTPPFSFLGLILGIFGLYREGVLYRLCALAGVCFHLLIVLGTGSLILLILLVSATK